LQELFGGHIVGHDLWPLQSPYFILWGFLRERVYLNNAQSLEKLKHNIEQAALCRVTWNTLQRVDACLSESGGHFQHLL